MPGPERGTHSCRVGYGRGEQNASPWIWQPPASSGSSSVGPGSSERAVVALFGLRPATLFFTMDALPALFRQARSPRSLLAARLPEMRRSDCEVSRNRGRRGFTERSVPGLKGASEAQRERGVSHAGGPNGPDEPCPELIAAWASSRSPSRPVVRESGAGSAGIPMLRPWPSTRRGPTALSPREPIETQFTTQPSAGGRLLPGDSRVEERAHIPAR